jgi:hypothetical protein
MVKPKSRQKRPKPVPSHRSEDDEREFWAADGSVLGARPPSPNLTAFANSRSFR